MDEKRLFEACHTKLKEEGKASEDAARECIKYISQENRKTTASMGKVSISTTDNKKSWIIICTILILIVILSIFGLYYFGN